MTSDTLLESAATVLQQNLGLEEGETLAILHDGNDERFIDAFMDAAGDIGSDYAVVRYRSDSHGSEPGELAASVMQQVDAFVAPTQYSISHTQVREQASEGGVRGAGMPTVTEDIFRRQADMDYDRIAEQCEELYDQLTDDEELRITTPSGTDLSVTVDLDSFYRDDGDLTGDSDYGNIPAGEVPGPALEAEGTLVVDYLPFPDMEQDRMTVEIEDGQVQDVDGDGELADAIGEKDCMENVAEVGLGVVDGERTGNILYDEKLGPHVAFGDDTFYLGDDGTSCDMHIDTLLTDATVYMGDDTLMRDGEYTV